MDGQLWCPGYPQQAQQILLKHGSHRPHILLRKQPAFPNTSNMATRKATSRNELAIDTAGEDQERRKRPSLENFIQLMPSHNNVMAFICPFIRWPANSWLPHLWKFRALKNMLEHFENSSMSKFFTFPPILLLSFIQCCCKFACEVQYLCRGKRQDWKDCLPDT